MQTPSMLDADMIKCREPKGQLVPETASLGSTVSPVETTDGTAFERGHGEFRVLHQMIHEGLKGDVVGEDGLSRLGDATIGPRGVSR